MKNRKSQLPWIFPLLTLALLGLVSLIVFIPMAARQAFGAPSVLLNSWQRFSYAFELIWNAGDLTQPNNPAGVEQLFTIDQGENAYTISTRLEAAGFIPNARTFRIYLSWTGLDTYMQTGIYRLSPALSAELIAGMLKSTTLTEVVFPVLQGWRMEEIAASLPTSGLEITPEAFLAAAVNPGAFSDLIPVGATAEGFLFPKDYILPRTTTPGELISLMLQQFSLELTPALRDRYSMQGFSVYQAVTLASIIEREAIMEDEMPVIASVFFNRLAIGMKLQTDPTVQYAIGYNASQGTWWTNPLSAADLQFDSLFNTYLISGLPPAPISNPGIAALTAVAFPADTNYFFFQAKCDHSGWHNFSETFEQHQQNYCP